MFFQRLFNVDLKACWAAPVRTDLSTVEVACTRNAVSALATQSVLEGVSVQEPVSQFSLVSVHERCHEHAVVETAASVGQDCRWKGKPVPT